MKTNTITADVIFKTNQVLTYEAAKSLIGRTIATTHPTARENTPYVNFVKITGFASEWDYYGTVNDCENYSSRQEYWRSYMTERQINESKSTLLLLGENGTPDPHFIRIHIENPYFDEPTATCSDIDREVYYIVCDEN